MSDPGIIIEYMNDVVMPSITPSEMVSTDPENAMPEPMERLEARICELAGHLTAATCQFLLLIADFDARQGWADWEMPSCAAWLSWRCQIAPGTARDQVRVARALGGFPLITTEFAAGRLSYAKVRALTRIVTPETEADLLEMALPMTAGQLERFAQAHRKVTREQEQLVRSRRKFCWHWVDDFEFAFRGLLPPEQAAVVLQALRAAMGDLEHPHDHDHDEGGVSAETRAARLKEQDDKEGVSWEGTTPPASRREDAGDLATALVEICAEYLNTRAAHADNPDTYQVIIHAGAEAITADDDQPEPQPASAGPEPAEGTEPGRVSAETRPSLPISHPAFPMRCHLEDGPAISPQALKLIGCNATISTMLHDADGTVLNVGRRTRKPPAALRRAVRERDRYRCRFPGCESRRTDTHHIIYWSNGGETRLSGLISLCKRHHAIVHDKGIIIATIPDGFAFYTREGIPIPTSPPLPRTSGDITTSHDAAITPSTIIPPNSGERLDLHLAIWIALTNASTKAERRQRERQAQAQAA
jgi:5-methylcytosine-specific restriction endonuclease McrA